MELQVGFPRLFVAVSIGASDEPSMELKIGKHSLP